MAKNRAIELVEQHLEKLVLGVCLLLFLVAAGYWGLSSPRTVELPGIRSEEPVPPSEVDEYLLDLATAVMGKVEAKEPNESSAPDYVTEVRQLFSGPRPGHALGAFGRPAKVISTTEGPELDRIGLTELTSVMPAPTKPLVKAVRVLPNRAAEEQTDELVAHVLIVYPWQELSEAWKTRVGVSGVPYKPTAVGLAVQVQEQLRDGGWGPPREVTGVFEPALDPMGTPIPMPEVPAYDGTNAGFLAQLRDALSAPSWQTYLLQPNYWQIWWPGYGWVDWRVNLPENEVSTAAQAFLEETGGTAGGVEESTYAHWTQPAVRSVYAAPGRPEYEYEDEEEVGSPAVNTLTALIEQIPAPELPVVPDIMYQTRTSGKVLAWFHDDSLQPLKVYRYRVGVKFLNPLLGFDNVVKEPAFAATPLVTTPFSEWSDPVEVPQPTEFFLNGAREAQGRVTVFTRSTGQQVKQRFSIVPGQSIGGLRQIELTNPADGSVGEVPVDFATGAIVVQFRVTETSGKTITEMLYLDEKGDLRTKVAISSLPRTDREYLRYKELEQKEKVTRLAAEAAKAALQQPGP